MSQPTPKADQLRALREAKFSKRGKDAQTNHGAVRKSSRGDGGGVPAVVQPVRARAKKAVGNPVKSKGRKLPVAKGKKQTARKRKPADR